MPESKDEIEKPALAAMKNRSFSVGGSNIEPKTSLNEDRRRSISSVGSNEEEKRIPSNTSDIINGKVQSETYSRPESRTDMYMKKIEENEDDLITSKKQPSYKSPSPVNNSVENIAEKVSNVVPSSSPTLSSYQQINRSPSPTAYQPSPSPQPKSPSYNVKTPEKTPEKQKSPIRAKQELKEEIVTAEKQGRKTPEIKTSGSAKLRLFKT
ncbi:hypothetical protein ILUMI_12958, partial [Ignelater luminosus]